MKVLVMGGDGFLGSHFAECAVQLGHEITVFDRFPYGVTKNLQGIQSDVRLVSGEFANRNDVGSAVEGQEVAYHFISATNPVSSWENPLFEVEENLRHSIQFSFIRPR